MVFCSKRRDRGEIGSDSRGGRRGRGRGGRRRSRVVEEIGKRTVEWKRRPGAKLEKIFVTNFSSTVR